MPQTDPSVTESVTDEPETQALAEPAADAREQVPPFCTVALDPPVAEAGGWMEVAIRLDDAIGPEIEGREVAILDAAGEERARGPVVRLDDGTWGVEPAKVAAPRTPGSQVWTAVLVPLGDGDEEPPHRVAFDVGVNAHRISVRVWELPDVVEAGSPVSFRVGVKCVAGCCSSGWSFAVRDAAGAIVAEGAVGDTPWRGTEGMFHAEIRAKAPAETGVTRWTVTAAAPEGDTPHVSAPVEVRLRTGPAADATLRVEVVDARTGAPVPRATVLAHPYRTRSDAGGVAVLRLPKGSYPLVVSGGKYFALETRVEVTGEGTVRAEMIEDREFSVEDAWS
jgi:hypothetical protein